MGEAKILLIENQESQFKKIKERFSEQEFIIFPPNDGENHLEFTEKIRIVLNSRYGTRSESKRKNAINQTVKYVKENKIDVLIIDHKLIGFHKAPTGIDLAKIFFDNNIRLPVIFLSRTPENDKDVKRNLKKIEGKVDYTWVEKGYAGEALSNDAYFENYVTVCIKNKLKDETFNIYLDKINSILEYRGQFKSDGTFEDLKKIFEQIKDKGKITEIQKDAIDNFLDRQVNVTSRSLLVSALSKTSQD
ncbi:hypothetical protein [Desulfobacula sp.]|uniref:hypothetical protein n=1 Tax=Desulfobacula sp. TaxID=2593537 RepID=UPI0025BAE114|nr:hypothetical protein [Desulfobacula sp.]MBC2705143.1 hypothetical protein [Desulfobacula sp.]